VVLRAIVGFKEYNHTNGHSLPADRFWYGLICSDGFVNTVGIAQGTSAFGANGGVGLTLRVRNTPWRFFLESRYNYAASRFIATQVAPVTFGFEYNEDSQSSSRGRLRGGQGKPRYGPLSAISSSTFHPDGCPLPLL
jgi:hypothetical protein